MGKRGKKRGRTTKDEEGIQIRTDVDELRLMTAVGSFYLTGYRIFLHLLICIS